MRTIHHLSLPSRLATLCLALCLSACDSGDTSSSQDSETADPPSKTTTSDDPLQIRRISPSGEDVEPGQQLVIQFDRKMVDLGDMRVDDDKLPISITPDPDCEWRWLNTDELSCRLSGETRFAPATKYRIEVSTELESLDGSRLNKKQTASFATWRPKVDATFLRNWASAGEPELRVNLNEPVTADALADHLVFTGVDGENVKAKVEPDEETRNGPILLPVPDHPGAVLTIDNPQPDNPLDADKKASEARRIWLVKPAHELATASDYQLQLKQGLKTPLGPLGGDAGEEALEDITTFAEFDVVGLSCWDANDDLQEAREVTGCRPEMVSLQFNAPMPTETLEAIEWDPVPQELEKARKKTKDTLPWSSNYNPAPHSKDIEINYGLPFYPDPMTTHRITIPAGVEDRFGRQLKEAVTLTLGTGHLRPSLDFPHDDSVLEANQDTLLPFSFINLDSLYFTYQTLTAAQLANNATPAPAQTHYPMQRGDLEVKDDEKVYTSLAVRDWLQGKSGVVWGGYNKSPGSYTKNTKFKSQVTPYQVLAKIGHYDSLVWVNRLDDGKPVDDVVSTIMHGHDENLAPLKRDGVTAAVNEQGIARLPGTIDLGDKWTDRYQDDRDYYVSVVNDAVDNMALLPLVWNFTRDIGVASDYQLHSMQEREHGHLRGWAVTSQGIYRPGSKVKYTAFVRNVGSKTLEAPPDLQYTLRIRDPKGNDIVERKNIHLSEYGDIQGEVEIPDNAPMGDYDIILSLPDNYNLFDSYIGEFQVADFQPDDFQVSTRLKNKQLQPGDDVTASVEATLHAGGPYTNAEVELGTQLLAMPFSPNNGTAARFKFGDNEELPSDQALSDIESRLDHKGREDFTSTLPADTDIEYGVVRVEGRVRSARSTWVANSASVPFTAHNRFVGLRTDNWVQKADESFKADFIVTDPDGELQSGEDIEMTLERRDISRVRSKDGADKYDKEEKTRWQREDRCTATSANTPQNCELTPKQAGSYRIVAEVKSGNGNTQRSTLSTWVTGPGDVVWSSDNQGVNMVFDENEYEPGDTANVMIQNPYGANAQALITVERHGILWYDVVELDGAAPVVEIPIKDEFFPGAFLSVAIFSPRVSPPTEPDLGEPELALGYESLRVVGKGSALNVDVEPEHEEYRPQDRVKVDVQVKDVNGEAPGNTRLVATVVDQGVLDLLTDGADYFDPLATFYAPPSNPDMANYSLVEKLLTRFDPKEGKGKTPGGDGADDSTSVRDDFKQASYWNATLETDANGHAEFEFDAPDNLTRWRILVVAVRPDDAMGLGDDSVRVNLPLQVEPALPNQVRSGDHFGASFNVTNRTDDWLKPKTSLFAEGAVEEDAPASTSKLKLNSFEHGLNWLWLTAGRPGNIMLTATTTAGGDLQDGVKADLPVLSAGSDVTAAEYGSTVESSEDVPVKVPSDAVLGSANLNITFSPTLVGGLDGAIRAMRDGTLKSWEARLSRAVMAANYLQLKPALGDSVDWPDAEAAVKEVLADAADYQAPNGGMAYWSPRDEFTSDYLSVYTALAFSWLHETDHAPPADMEKALWDYLIEHVINSSDNDGPQNLLKIGLLVAQNHYPDDTDAFNPSDTNSQLDASNLDLFGKALLMQGGLASGGDDSDPESPKRQQIDIWVEELLSQADESGGKISFNERRSDGYAELLSTPLRANCAILDAFSQYRTTFGENGAVGDTPEKLMRWVVEQRETDGSWPNTQENIFCSTAIRHYADAFEPEVEALTGTVGLASDTSASQNKAEFQSRADASVTLDPVQPERGKADDVRVKREGEGRLYYNVLLKYALPAESVTAANAGMTLKREYHVQDGDDWHRVDDDTKLKRGDVVRVDLTVDAPSKRHHVALTDPLPGAFEAVNRELATSASNAPDHQETTTTLMFDAGPWPNMEIDTGGFYHREMGFDAVTFYADTLPAGRYRLVYSAQVIAPGEFIAPAPKVEEVYHPDVFGRDVPQTLRIARPED